MRARTIALALVVLSTSATAFAAPADGEKATTDEHPAERARTTFEQARQAFARKSYVAAASAFEQSASYMPHPGPWVNAAEAWILAGDPVRAARACDRALAFPEIDEATRVQAAERLQKVVPRIGTVELTGPSLPVRVDEGETHSLPTTMRLSPGAHAFEVVVGAAVLDWSIDLRAGATVKREIALRDGAPVLRGADAPPVPPERPRPPSPSPDRSTAPPPRSGVPTLGIVGYGVSAAATVTAVIFGLATLDAHDHFRDDGARSRFYLDRALTNVSIGVAVVAALGATIVWLRRPSPHAR